MSFSKIIKKVSVVGAFGLLGLMGSDSAQAASFQGNAGDSVDLIVSVTVDANCLITAPSGVMAFGSYDFVTGAQASSDIVVNCSNGVDWEIHPQGGLNGTRLMDGQTGAAIGATLQYDILDAPALGGGATVNDGAPLVGTGDGTDQTTTLYGDIAGGLTPPDGDYTDTLAVQLWY